MYRLRLFGGASLEGPSGPLTGRAVQPRNLALLALLAVAGRSGCSRDKLIGLLWPESDEERGRHHLSQSLYLLRKALGQEAIPSIGDSVGLELDLVRTDVGAFQDALDRGELQVAEELYSGPFLDGVYVKDAAGFEEWVDGERRRLASAYSQALEALATAAVTTGDHAAAIRWWERLLAQDPFNSATVVQLMQALAARGDPANAIQVAREHERLLSEEFDLALPAEVVSLSEELRNSVAGVQAGRESAVQRREGSPLPPPPGTASRSEWRPRRAGAGQFAAAALVVALALIVGWSALSSPGEPPVPIQNSVMVFPFNNVSGEPELEDLALWAGWQMEVALASVDGFRVFGSRDVDPIRRELRGTDSLEGQSLATAMVEFVGADHQLRSSLYAHSDSVTLETRLVAFPSFEVVVARGATVHREGLEEAIQLLADSLQVATATRFGLLPMHLESYGRGSSFDAWKEVDTARKLWAEDRNGEALAHLWTALEIDPTYDAAVGLAMIWSANFGEFARADSLYRSLNRRITAASEHQRWQLAVATALLRRDRVALLDAFRERTERVPVLSSFEHQASGAMRVQRPAECIAALDNVPVNEAGAGTFIRYAVCHHGLGEYGSAVRRARQGLEQSPDDRYLRYQAARSEAALGRPGEAVEFAEEILRRPASAGQSDAYSEDERFEYLVGLGLELDAHGHPAASANVLASAVEWYAERYRETTRAADRWRLARAQYASRRWEHAAEHFASLTPEELLADSLLFRHNIDVSLLGYRGTLAARLGDDETARRIDGELAALDRPLLWGHADYWRSAIAAVRGDRDAGAEHLETAIQKGLFARQWGTEYPKWDYHIDPDFRPLLDYPPFEELVAPRG
jgi:DNA-binding SARP family transcriptional activator